MSRSFEPLAADAYRDLVRRALAEDIGRGDITTAGTVDPSTRVRAIVLAKSQCVVAGLDVAIEAFRQLDPSVQVKVHCADGTLCVPGTVVAEISGRADALLIGERTALNFIQRLSGIATLTGRFVAAAAGRITVLDTRKTTPLMRVLEKYAVRAGGGTNHRFGLDDGILIKDNHVRLAGGVVPAVQRMRAANKGLPIEVEAQSLYEVDAALEAGADIVLLDNLSTKDIIAAVGKSRGKARTEISGGVTLDRMPELAATGADFVSIGALTHSAPAADLSFEIEMGSGVI
ncbi:MAG TPA: carboxylating nicotinate-nucleotide diphosphorylase [Vicinamibacterales bacterium]|nr:carboxylating nicotinate-nucleotide diphosphorylase [Vicinamibacterales bacterium]